MDSLFLARSTRDTAFCCASSARELHFTPSEALPVGRLSFPEKVEDEPKEEEQAAPEDEARPS